MGEGKTHIIKGQLSRRAEEENVNDKCRMMNSRKRKGSPADRQIEGKMRQEHVLNMNRETGDAMVKEIRIMKGMARKMVMLQKGSTEDMH